MGCRILEAKNGECVFYCSNTDWAFGPVFEDRDEAEEFFKWLNGDPRSYTKEELQSKYNHFLMVRCQHEGEHKNGVCLECGKEL